MNNDEFAEIKYTLEKCARRTESNPIELWPHECKALLAKLERLTNLEQLLKHYKAERKRLLEITDPNLYTADPNRYDEEELKS